MKKLYSLLFLFIGFTAFGQAFHKNDIVINAGVGLGVYGTRSVYVNTANGTRDRENGGAVSFIVPITAEYAIHHKWGLGLQLAPAAYANDFSYKKTTSFSLGVFGAYHFFTRDRFELYTRLGVGFATLAHREDRRDGQYSWRLGGLYVRPSIGMRTYISTNFGVFADLALAHYSLSASEYGTPTGKVTLDDERLWFRANGVELSTGLVVKF